MGHKPTGGMNVVERVEVTIILRCWIPGRWTEQRSLIHDGILAQWLIVVIPPS
ncbi:hypothetical protein KCP71_25300 [Salmonella enterica subsp. enterica]|nr:hypothetical protein KCP71_25300 [Salmonella enterica subsp. enterica]